MNPIHFLPLLYYAGFKFRFYSANFKCSQPGGYVCKYAISAEEDNTVHLNPRESASTFILRKPGLNGKIGSASFELDYRRGVFLKKDGTVLTVGANDGSKQFGTYHFCLCYLFLLNISYPQT